jgi:group I intron endonuclease
VGAGWLFGLAPTLLFEVMQFNIPAEHKNAAGVYIIRNTINSKVYVGSSLNFWRRYTRHKSRITLGNHHSLKLQNFANKHGISTLSFSLLEICEPNKEAYLAVEQKWIDLLHCVQKGFNVNPTASSRLGAKGRPLTVAQKAAISKAHTGKKVSSETRLAMSEAAKGRQFTEETKAKMRTARADFTHSPETKAKMSATRTGLKLNISDEERTRRSERCKNRIITNEIRANMSAGQRGRKVTEETKQKMREAHARSSTPEIKALRLANRLKTIAERGPAKRPPVSKETRQMLSEAGKGRKFSAETLEKMKLSAMGRVASEETRQKMSESAKRRRRLTLEDAQAQQMQLPL